MSQTHSPLSRPGGAFNILKNTHKRTLGKRQGHRGYLVFLFFFSVKDRNLFHRVDTIGNTFTSGAATSENITDGVHEMK